MLLTGLVISLTFSVFFAGIEISFLSANKLRLELCMKENGISGSILKHYFKHPVSFMTTLQVGYFISIVGFILFFSKIVLPILRPVCHSNFTLTLISILINALAVLTIGEFIPRTLFRLNPIGWIRALSYPLFLLYYTFTPCCKAASFISIKLLALCGVKRTGTDRQESFGKVDLDNMIRKSIDEASNAEEIEPEVKIFRNALDFSKIRLRDCIVPRSEIVAVEWNEKQEHLLDIFIETGLSKIIVFRENLDNILGYIHTSEMFEKPVDWHSCITHIPMVPETMTANKLMKQLMTEKKSIAAVLDEFGTVSGIVTMEDLVEEIFGEIEDEHDTQTYISKQVSNNEYIFSGKIEIDKINAQYNLNLEENEAYTTLAGLILFHYHKFPKPNETIDIGTYSFKIIKVSATRIDLIRLKVT
jgi:Hemolysins and related proteins containing CBS domains